MSSPLQLSYLVFAHKNPTQLARLLNRLNAPGCVFYIHVDAKADIKAFRAAAHQLPAHRLVWLPKRTAVSWGDFSLTSAYLAGFETILQQRPKSDFILTISGQDYPLVTNKTLQEWLADHRDKSILDHALVTEDSPHILERVEQYYLSIKPHRTIVYPYPKANDWKKKAFNSAIKLSRFYKLPRQFPMGHQMYFGTNWFQLKPVAVRYILEFIKANPSYVNFARTTFVAEEFFFQSILLNAPDKIRRTIYNERITFMQWDRPPGSYFIPLLSKDLPAMLDSGKLFARKFDETADSQILDQLDRHLSDKEPSE